MELILLIAADYANVTETSKLNVIGVFNRIIASEFPIRHRDMFIVAQVLAQPSEANLSYNFELKYVDSKDKQLGTVTGNFTVPPSPDKVGVSLNHLLRIVDLPVPKPGVYRFIFLINDQPIGTVKLYAIKTRAQGAKNAKRKKKE